MPESPLLPRIMPAESPPHLPSLMSSPLIVRFSVYAGLYIVLLDSKVAK